MPYRMRGKANLSDDECDLRDMRNRRDYLVSQAENWREAGTPRAGTKTAGFIERAERIETVYLPALDARIEEIVTKIEADVADRKARA